MPEKSLAVQRAEEKTTLKPVKFESLLSRMDEVFNRITKRAFEIFEGNGRVFGHEIDNWLKAEREFLHPVHIQLTESGESLDVQAEVPGFNEKDLEVNVEPCRVTISGKRETSKEQKKGKTVYSEACCDQILRVVDLPAEVETDKVTATLKNGVLALTMPKVAKARGIRIQPKAA
ncbi:MAG: Hsp20 family protein [Acidobacteriia bacterium]|nr:Hsp20 family protein [Terriglobia bacterium]